MFPERPEFFENPHYFRLELLQNSASSHRQKNFDMCELECPAEEKLSVLFSERHENINFSNFSLETDLQTWPNLHTLKNIDLCGRLFCSRNSVRAGQRQSAAWFHLAL